ncbi:hypothetical protein F5Y14DRAFT_409963 [Nemania sp. NC0429]|nr:hypothetical protein F5Y14DRAFT_409963 [Nemania sp. NC0429]
MFSTLNHSRSGTRLISAAWRNVSIRSAPRSAPLRSLISPKRPAPGSIRFKTTTSTSTAPTSGTSAAAKPAIPLHKNAVYGPTLCIYHAGTGKVTFLACLKLSTLFIFVFFGIVIAPAYYKKEGMSLNVARSECLSHPLFLSFAGPDRQTIHPRLVISERGETRSERQTAHFSILAALSAVVPLVFVAYITAPFVTFIHMRVPPFARQSEALLRRYVRTPPPQTELQITTMSFIAKPRTSTVKLRDLRPASRRFGIVNMTRDTAADNAARRWFMYRAVGNFNVQRGSGTSRVPWVWDAIWDHVNAK